MVQNFSCAPVASSLRRTFSYMHTCMLTCRNSVLGATPSTPLGFSWNLSLKCSDCFKTHLLPEAGDSVERCFGMLFTLGSVNIGEGRGKKNGALGTTSIFSPTCLPLQCWSSEVFIRGLNPRYFIPFRNYLEMSILLSVMFPSKIASERKPQELLVWPNVADNQHWQMTQCSWESLIELIVFQNSGLFLNSAINLFFSYRKMIHNQAVADQMVQKDFSTVPITLSRAEASLD